MSRRARLIAVAFGVLLLPALGVACGGAGSARATMAAPAVVEESPDLSPGEGESGDRQPLLDSTVTAEPASYEPAPPQPEPEPAPPLPPEPPQLTPAEIANIKALLIQASIDEYDGSCPCPYNEARDGSRCGGRSAYSRPGGEEPLCYPEDVSDQMVNEYWASQQ